ncbi:Protein kinase-like domain protein [Cordyceps fumosorosea ARSEF 2679]|uniref:Protein kinase-like domain protein n=1 Tax=Cordyceps fumosorosea (strain ARSEF 2679) TaxID=1081104 RepID=A0A167R1K4_CORFA|nr:Protein kinase-like domain protein [Cordyceps fumosorosea ARSEF 2679]OAA58184.1 Protein kinase-like domain protein [Cordyceps fumosorosea ARSEF 2679]
MKTMEQLQEIADSLTLQEMRNLKEEAGYYRSGFPYPLDSESPWFYIKYGKHSSALTRMEAETREFTYNALQEISLSAVNKDSLPCVPKIFRVIWPDFVVMEYREGRTLQKLAETLPWEEQLSYIRRIAKAIDILLSIPIPADATPGPYGGGLILHPLFKDAEAPKLFKDVASLRAHVNYMSGMPQNHPPPSGAPPRPQCALDSRLYLVWGDFNPGNFIFDANGFLCLIDFENVNLLPLCFQTYALHYGFPISTQYGWAVSDAMETALPTHNMETFIRAHTWFVRCAAWMGVPEEERYRKVHKYIVPDDIKRAGSKLHQPP